MMQCAVYAGAAAPAEAGRVAAGRVRAAEFKREEVPVAQGGGGAVLLRTRVRAVEKGMRGSERGGLTKAESAFFLH